MLATIPGASLKRGNSRGIHPRLVSGQQNTQMAAEVQIEVTQLLERVSAQTTLLPTA